MTKRPLGLRSASTGTRRPIRAKSSSLSRTPAAWAMARRCSTALVEPPRAITTVMAFSKALRVRMSRGRTPRAIRSTTARPARSQSSRFASETAAWAELLGRLIPRASIAEAMVLAVYMPPQEPAPGMAQASSRSRSRSLIAWRACCPTASKTETMSTLRFRNLPGRMVPP